MAEDDKAYGVAKAKRTQAKSACTRGKTFVDELEARQVSVAELRQRQAKFPECWQAFNEAQSQIELIETSSEQVKAHEVERRAFEDKYFAVAAKLEEKILSISAVREGPNPFDALARRSNRDNIQPPNINMRLPRIDLPMFSGSYEDWRPFRDVFYSMIHENTALPAIQKMHYLKASLKNEAADVISSLELSDANYQEALEMLDERYDNQRVIVQKHIKAIFEYPVLYKENHIELRQLLDTVLKHLRALKVLERSTDHWDDLVVHIITSKLAPATNKEWETSLKDSSIPTLKDLTDFLSHRCRALEAIDRKPQGIASSRKIDKGDSKKSMSANAVTDRQACGHCKGDHPIFRRNKFLELSVDKRIQEIKGLKLCLNCLKHSDHRAKQCNAGLCKKCNKRHNTLLHMESSLQPTDTEVSSEKTGTSAASSTTSTYHATRAAGHHVLLSTAVVHVQDQKGNMQPCRALLDNGSQSNFVSTELVKRLGVKQVPTCIPINGVGGARSETHSMAKIKLKSRFNGYKAELNCFVLRKITQDLPTVSIHKADIRVPEGITLADPEFLESSRIDMIIGVEIFWNIMCVGQIKATETQPCWQKTHFGWIAAGRAVARASNPQSITCNHSTTDELSQLMRSFWEVEHGARKNKMSLDERKCEEMFESTVQRNSSGRFIVKLPLKLEEVSRLGLSRDIAVRRFKQLERRLNRDAPLKKEYTKFMHEYESLGHMRELQDVDLTQMPHYYLPHHCVVKEENSTTKIRVVFDASCKTTSGLSLNDALMVGPVLQQELFSIMVRFRTFKYALIADITKMYRQILVDEAQTPLQRIVWRDEPHEKMKEFELTTLTYGTASASFLAIKAVRTLAETEARHFSIGSQTVLRDFYVDDLITGANSIEEALQIRDETTKLLKKGGFVLHKWASNEAGLLKGIPEPSAASSIRPLDKEGGFRTLGIQWNPTEDAFQYSVMADVDNTQRSTKRAILSCIARIFDPLGLLGPVIVRAKLFMQRLWILQVDWDESLPADVYTEWVAYKSQLKRLNELRIARMVLGAQIITRVELHGFCDASQQAYGACVYLRVTGQDGSHHTRLLCSRSRVAPMKSISLPRLELCGAQLLSQLIDKILPILDLKVHETYYWTDATIVLDWIRSPSRVFNTFVANRIGEIQELTQIASWRHVSTNENPADILSRGTDPETFSGATLWWNGPSWINKDKSLWPGSTPPDVNPEELLERRKITISNVTIQECDLIEGFSSYIKLVRTIARCLRFIYNVRTEPSKRRSGPIAALELEEARKVIVRRIQQAAFHNEIEAIKNQADLPRGSRLLGLNPFLDQEDLLRVGGRLRHSALSYETKHQLILPSHNRFTQFVIEHKHARLLHAGPQATLGALRLQYWILGARGIIRTIVHKCVPCFKAGPRASQQVMGDLPSFRVKPSRPFDNSGVDYCGPIFIREGNRRNARRSKAWIAIFVCLVTKAVHIELVTTLSTEGFLNALKRFIGRRGKPSNMFSDNGTNFVGANRELEELRDLFNREEFRHSIVNKMAEEAITWHFIPPKAPHFGGLWEAAVRSAKLHLNRVTSSGALTFEETATLLTQIEAILNSRPLTPLSTDPEDQSYITPGHFLIGDSLISYPEPCLQELPENRLSRWQRVEQMRQHFWKRWSVDYLHQMQQRTKWKESKGKAIEPGQMVIVREGDLPPQSWLIGRIEAVHPGTDGVVRAASVKTVKGTFKRPANKICVLPIEENI